VFGSAKLLSFDIMDQVVIDFDLSSGVFSFIDREELLLSYTRQQLVDLFVLQGMYVFPMLNSCHDYHSLSMLLDDLKSQSGKAKKDCDQAKIPYDDLVSLLQDDLAPILNHRRKLSVLKDSAELSKETGEKLKKVLKMVFNDDIYYWMS
jgi:hypothetical protein